MFLFSCPPFRLSNYFNLGRNLLRIRDRDVKSKALKQGRLPVVTFLTELPQTQHDPQSFAVDLTLFTVRKKNSSNLHSGMM